MSCIARFNLIDHISLANEIWETEYFAGSFTNSCYLFSPPTRPLSRGEGLTGIRSLVPIRSMYHFHARPNTFHLLIICLSSTDTISALCRDRSHKKMEARRSTRPAATPRSPRRSAEGRQQKLRTGAKSVCGRADVFEVHHELRVSLSDDLY